MISWRRSVVETAKLTVGKGRGNSTYLQEDYRGRNRLYPFAVRVERIGIGENEAGSLIGFAGLKKKYAKRE